MYLFWLNLAQIFWSLDVLHFLFIISKLTKSLKNLLFLISHRYLHLSWDFFRPIDQGRISLQENNLSFQKYQSDLQKQWIETDWSWNKFSPNLMTLILPKIKEDSEVRTISNIVFYWKILPYKYEVKYNIRAHPVH